MADKRDGQNEDEPKIQIVDRRLLSDDERAGKGASTPAEDAAEETSEERPKLEIIGGGAPAKKEAESANGIEAADEDGYEIEEGDELSEEERAQMRAEMENEQFAELEKQVGRPLTSQEKDAVRQEMQRQAESVSRLEVEPLIMQLMAEMSARAAVHLGLMPNPYTRLVARNDLQARLAIDTFGSLLEVLRPHLDPEMRKEFERVLNDLRVNFASITGTQPTTPGGGFGGFGGGGPRIIH
jgi:hypothetical protein